MGKLKTYKARIDLRPKSASRGLRCSTNSWPIPLIYTAKRSNRPGNLENWAVNREYRVNYGDEGWAAVVRCSCPFGGSFTPQARSS